MMADLDMDTILLRLRLGIHKDNLPMILFGVMGVMVMAISFLAGSNVFVMYATRISGSAYILLMLYLVFVKKHDHASID